MDNDFISDEWLSLIVTDVTVPLLWEGQWKVKQSERFFIDFSLIVEYQNWWLHSKQTQAFNFKSSSLNDQSSTANRVTYINFQ